MLTSHSPLSAMINQQQLAHRNTLKIPTALQGVASTMLLKQNLDQQVQEKNVLEQQLKRKMANLRDTSLLEVAHNIESLTMNSLNLHKTHVFKAHQRAIRAMAWSKSGTHIVTASDDNNLIVWNSRTGLKEHFEQLQTADAYVFACDISPNDNLIACGGLSNCVSIFRMNNNNSFTANSSSKAGNNNLSYDSMVATSIVCRFKEHEDWISGLKFVNDNQVISTSSDRKCIMWDIDKGQKARNFADSLSDITGISICPNTNGNVFVTSSAYDSSVRLYDVRDSNRGGVIDIFGPVGDDATCVTFAPSGNTFAVGSRESSITLFDIRSGNIALEQYNLPILQSTKEELLKAPSPLSIRFKNTSKMLLLKKQMSASSVSTANSSSSTRIDSTSTSESAMYVDGVESLSFLNSGRILFTCTQDLGCVAFDILKGETVKTLDNYSSLVLTSPDGYAVLTASGPGNCLELWSFQ